jgi:hypothetical protein
VAKQEVVAMTFEEWWEIEDRVYLNEYSTFKMVAAQVWNHQQKRIDALEATVKAHQIRPRGKSMLSYLPEGYVLVPVEMTNKMFKAGVNAHDECGDTDCHCSITDMYEAMIQAAQEGSNG